MVSMTGATFKTLMNLTDSDLTDTEMENVIDAAINRLNLYGADLPNMGGTVGSKTVSLESKEVGAVQMVARPIYYSFFKGVESTTIGGMTVSSPDLDANPAVQRATKEAARLLTELEVGLG